jgi:lipoate-protein ligase A
MFSILRLEHTPIYEQLQLEEALLRADDRQWCLINQGSTPAIVMGISGKPQLLLNIPEVLRADVPVIRRYSGGGTVIVNSQTLFISFIGNGKKTPKDLLEEVYDWIKPLFPPNFSIKENDFTLSDYKIAGNAQYLATNRWVHHLTILWDFDPAQMGLLKLPEKRPAYREDRDHTQFLCRLKDFYPCQDSWLKALEEHLIGHLTCSKTDFDFKAVLQRPHRKSTTFVDLTHSADL